MKKIIAFLILFSLTQSTLICSQSPFDEFMKGYIHSKLEDNYCSENLQFEVENRRIIFFTYPESSEKCGNIKSYLQTLTGYDVIFDCTYASHTYGNNQYSFDNDECASKSLCEEELATEDGEWLPELSPFFPTMLAQPHIIGYSAGYRSYDKVFRRSCLPVSIGDQFSLYQIMTPYKGQLFVGIEACVWAVFEAKTKSLSLLNADYYVAVPLTYINNDFSMRLRLYHQSSHLGDEFLLDQPDIVRLNPSMEVIDMSFAYDFGDWLTMFAGFSNVLRSDDSYKIKPWGVYYGFNYFLDFVKLKICNLEASPYIATYFTNLEDNNWHFDSSFAVGYQWNKQYGHKLRIFLEGHDGYSPDGQYSKERTRYLAIKLLYGY